MLEKITENLISAEFHELKNKKETVVKVFFLQYVKTLPFYFKYPIIIYMNAFNFLSIIFYLQTFSKLDITKSIKFIKILLKYFPGFQLFQKFYRTLFLLSNYE
tara:strand:- start:520 stop:828 length:309 start_codon:yes stop_codon:yes gene_type:complete